MKKKMVVIYTLLFLIVLAGAWAFFVEPYVIKIEKITLELERENLPQSLKNLKIVHLSDLHSKNFGKREKKVLEILNKLNPDFIFITGDIVDWKTRDLDSCQRFWQEFNKNYQGKIFAVLGNHEHRNPKFKTILFLLEKSGIEILNNQAKKITLNGSYFYLIGLDDPHLGFDDIEKAMTGVEAGTFKILLTHSPKIFRKIKPRSREISLQGEEKDIDLVLTGHTHGGQVNIPFLVNFILPMKYDKKYKRGLFQEEETYLYVNRGVGTTILPIRFNSLPEITLIKFK